MGTDDSTMAGEVTKGRKRFISLISLIAFALIAGAADANDWVKGGLELADGNGSASGNSLHWHVDLRFVSIETNINDVMYGPNLYSRYYARPDYMKRILAQSTYVSPAGTKCVRGKADDPISSPFYLNYWCGIDVKNFNSSFDATYGLLIFAALLSFIAWILMQSLAGGNVAVLSWEHSFRAIGLLMAASCFFSFVGVVNFAGANIESTFCQVLDPPNGDTSFGSASYCSYSDVSGVTRSSGRASIHVHEYHF